MKKKGLFIEEEIFNLLKVNVYSLVYDSSCKEVKQITGKKEKKREKKSRRITDWERVSAFSARPLHQV